VPLVFVFTLIGVNSTALTSITPTGPMGKLTQLTYGVLDPGNIKTNLMTAGITAEVASNASNLLMDIISARWAALAGALLGLAFEGVRLATRGRFWISGGGFGLATVIPFHTCLAMFLGSFFFWLAGRIFNAPESTAIRVIVQNQEPICGGVIASGALMGIAVILLENFVLTR